MARVFSSHKVSPLSVRDQSDLDKNRQLLKSRSELDGGGPGWIRIGSWIEEGWVSEFTVVILGVDSSLGSKSDNDELIVVFELHFVSFISTRVNKKYSPQIT